MKYWGYKHINGSIHLKVYREDAPHARESVEDAFSSPFVDEVCEPFEAKDRLEAEHKLKADLENQ